MLGNECCISSMKAALRATSRVESTFVLMNCIDAVATMTDIRTESVIWMLIQLNIDSIGPSEASRSSKTKFYLITSKGE